MLNFPFFSHSLLEKYSVLFGGLFSNINIARQDRETGQELSYFKVPLTYGAKDKMLVRLMQDPTLQKPSAIDLPMLSWEYNISGYDRARALNRNLTIVGPKDGASAMATTLTPVPYDITFKLHAYAKFEKDGQKIVEQVIPFFHPDMTFSVKLVPELNITRDIPLILQSVEKDREQYEGSFLDRPVLIWTFTFVMKALFFGPRVSRPVIKFVNTSFFLGANASEVGNAPAVAWANVYPGLDSNGHPTTNTEIAIDPLLVSIDDDWIAITEWHDRQANN